MVATSKPQSLDELPLSNHQIARRLEEIAGLLQAQDANLYRVRAYRAAADTVRRLDRRVADILEAKRKVFNDLLAMSDKPTALGLSEDEIFGLFDIRTRPRKKSEAATD